MNLIKKISDEIYGSAGDVVAIEMSPRLHLNFVRELLLSVGDCNDSCSSDRMFLGLPILFVHGDDSHYQLLDSNQYKIRVKYNELLKTYSEKYNRMNVFINGVDKMRNPVSMHQDELLYLKSLVERLDNLQLQINNLSRK